MRDQRIRSHRGRQHRSRSARPRSRRQQPAEAHSDPVGSGASASDTRWPRRTGRRGRARPRRSRRPPADGRRRIADRRWASTIDPLGRADIGDDDSPRAPCARTSPTSSGSAPTGAAMNAASASSTALASERRWSRSRRVRRLQRSPRGRASQPVVSAARRSRAASAIEPPIRPRPITAIAQWSLRPRYELLSRPSGGHGPPRRDRRGPRPSSPSRCIHR